jgi:hypothetical protein
MKNVELECTYCGAKWEDYVTSKADVERKICAKKGCGCSTLVVRDLAKKIDYYQGCPPFQEELDISKYFGNIYGRSD